MTDVDKNILTPDFYEFLISNKAFYGDAVMSQIHDATEKISLSGEEKETLAVVLSGYGTNISDGTSAYQGMFYNQVAHVSFGNNLSRAKIKFRSVDGMVYSQNMKDFTSQHASPLSNNITDDERQYLISLHPEAYTMSSTMQNNQMPYGTLVIVREVDGEFYIIENISTPMLTHTSPPGPYTGPKYDPAGDAALEKKYGLKRQSGIYRGRVTQHRNKTFRNGGLPAELLGTPNTTFWVPKGTGGGAILVDYLPSFNAMAAAFHAHFGKKLHSSGIRSFKQQITNRKRSTPKSVGGTKGEDAKCKSLKQRGNGCMTAIPGRSNHGWGQAVDIRYPGTHDNIGTGSKYYKWLVEKNKGDTGGFLGMKWGHLGQKGTILKGQTFEAWHWEPITGRVMEILD